MFHVELRRFPHVARAFNLSADELHTRIVRPWVRGAAVELQDRRFSSDRARLMIYEGPALAAEDRGLGRGWSAVTRDGEDVTARLLEAAGALVPRTSELKVRLLSAAPIPISRAVSLARDGHPGFRASELLAVAEQAVWELLHEGQLALEREGQPVAPEQWQPLLLEWRTWADASAGVVLRRSG